MTMQELTDVFATSWIAWGALSGLVIFQSPFGNITVGGVVSITFVFWGLSWVWAWLTGVRSTNDKLR